MSLREFGWLSLKILDAEDRVGASACRTDARRAVPLRISVPKKIVRLATRRNRIKRLIREAWRLGAPLSKNPGKVYLFRVEKMPARDLGLKDAQSAVKNLLC